MRISQALLDDAVLQAITEALDERILESAVEKALLQLRTSHHARLDWRPIIERELALIDARQKHLTDAIARGEQMDSLLVALKTEEIRKGQLVAELQDVTALTNTSPLEAGRIVSALKPKLADVIGLLGKHVTQARQMLRKLLINRLEMEPILEHGTRGYRFTGEGHYGRLLAGESMQLAVVAGKGFEPLTFGL